MIDVIRSLRGLERELLEVLPLGAAPGGSLQKIRKRSDVACGPKVAAQICD